MTARHLGSVAPPLEVLADGPHRHADPVLPRINSATACGSTTGRRSPPPGAREDRPQPCRLPVVEGTTGATGRPVRRLGELPGHDQRRRHHRETVSRERPSSSHLDRRVAQPQRRRAERSDGGRGKLVGMRWPWRIDNVKGNIERRRRGIYRGGRDGIALFPCWGMPGSLQRRRPC